MNSRLRRRAAAVAAGTMLMAGAGVAPAQAAYPPVSTPVVCLATAVAKASRIKVNVNPNLKGSRYYTFQIERLNSAGVFAPYGKVRRTKGKKELRTVNVRKGTYRVQCFGKYGLADATSATVTIKR